MRRIGVLIIVVLWAQVTGAQTDVGSAGSERLNAEGVTTLLDVMDALAEVHTGFVENEQANGRLDDAGREAAFGEARRLNESNAELVSAIDALLDTRTYQIYFRRFTNITAVIKHD